MNKQGQRLAVTNNGTLFMFFHMLKRFTVDYYFKVWGLKFVNSFFNHY